MQPIDLPLTFSGHPDQAQPLEAIELFGMRIKGNWPTDNIAETDSAAEGMRKMRARAKIIEEEERE